MAVSQVTTSTDADEVEDKPVVTTTPAADAANQGVQQVLKQEEEGSTVAHPEAAGAKPEEAAVETEAEKLRKSLKLDELAKDPKAFFEKGGVMGVIGLVLTMITGGKFSPADLMASLGDKKPEAATSATATPAAVTATTTTPTTTPVVDNTAANQASTRAALEQLSTSELIGMTTEPIIDLVGDSGRDMVRAQQMLVSELENGAEGKTIAISHDSKGDMTFSVTVDGDSPAALAENKAAYAHGLSAAGGVEQFQAKVQETLKPLVASGELTQAAADMEISLIGQAAGNADTFSTLRQGQNDFFAKEAASIGQDPDAANDIVRTSTTTRTMTQLNADGTETVVPRAEGLEPKVLTMVKDGQFTAESGITGTVPEVLQEMRTGMIDILMNANAPAPTAPTADGVDQRATATPSADATATATATATASEPRGYAQGVNGSAFTTVVTQPAEPTLVVNAAAGESNLSLSGAGGAFNMKSNPDASEVTTVDARVEQAPTLDAATISATAPANETQYRAASLGG